MNYWCSRLYGKHGKIWCSSIQYIMKHGHVHNRFDLERSKLYQETNTGYQETLLMRQSSITVPLMVLKISNRASTSLTLWLQQTTQKKKRHVVSNVESSIIGRTELSVNLEWLKPKKQKKSPLAVTKAISQPTWKCHWCIIPTWRNHHRQFRFYTVQILKASSVHEHMNLAIKWLLGIVCTDLNSETDLNLVSCY